MTVGSLFSGGGLFDYGLELAGHPAPEWQAECDPYALRVLEKHWPRTTRFDDVRKVGRNSARTVRLIVGGFPCQDLSHANHSGGGLAGPRSGLWSEFARVIGELRPREVVVENVASAWSDWVPVVRSDLWRLGYASVPVCLYASGFGAPHQRARVFVAGYADRDVQSARAFHEEMAYLSSTPGLGWDGRGPEARALGVDDGSPHGVDRRRICGNGIDVRVARAVGTALLRVRARGGQ